MSTCGKSVSRDYIVIPFSADILFVATLSRILETEDNHGNRYKGLICLGTNDIIAKTRCARDTLPLYRRMSSL